VSVGIGVGTGLAVAVGVVIGRTVMQADSNRGSIATRKMTRFIEVILLLFSDLGVL